MKQSGDQIRQRWSHDELLRALALYCVIPFGKMHSRTPAIIALAHELNRTPSAVALKLVNFASLDPELRGRGVDGMKNTSRADREIWREYYGNWDALARFAPNLDSEPETTHVRRQRRAPEGPTEVTRTAAVRRGQSFFRAAVLAAHESRCCITGIAIPELLRASHIVPWSESDGLARLDPRNGLCLNALHDSAFDRGLITLNDDLTLRLSSRLTRRMKGVFVAMPMPVFEAMFLAYADRSISRPERWAPDPDAVRYHREHVFQN